LQKYILELESHKTCFLTSIILSTYVHATFQIFYWKYQNDYCTKVEYIWEEHGSIFL